MPGGNNILGNIVKQFDKLVKQFEYTVVLNGKQIFPNNTIKQDIVTHYKISTFNIANLKYRILGFDVTASDFKIVLNPSRIDTVTTKVDMPVVIARNVTIAGNLLNLKYNEVNLGSIYGIYDKVSDRMVMHIPISIALTYIPRGM
jgi:hypothetical protein